MFNEMNCFACRREGWMDGWWMNAGAGGVGCGVVAGVLRAASGLCSEVTSLGWQAMHGPVMLEAIP